MKDFMKKVRQSSNNNQNDNNQNDNNQKNNKSKLPTIYIVLRIISILMLVAGVIFLIIGLTKNVPSMGQDGWFEASTSKSRTTFTGIGLLMFGGFLLYFSLAPTISKIVIKTQRYIVNENKDDLKGTMEDVTEIGMHGLNKNKDELHGIIKTGSQAFFEGKNAANEQGSSKETIFCSNCGKKINENSKFCRHCGSPQE